MDSSDLLIEQKYKVPIERINPFGKDELIDFQVFLSYINKFLSKIDYEIITKSFYFCYDNHKHIKRISGEPYYTHPLKVAISLITDFGVTDCEIIAAALLHDTIEDVDGVNYELLNEKFGKNIAVMVEAVTKIKGVKTRTMDKGATYSKLFLALIKNVMVIIIKLADRLDNLRTLHYLDKAHQEAIGYETLNFYTPIAYRLGLSKIRKDMEDLSLFFIDRNSFNILRQALENKQKIFIEFIKNFFHQISQKLNEHKIKYIITIEHKHIYEIYKMIEQGKNLNEIDNFYSIVITLQSNDTAECYRVYGIIANIFGPVNNLIDYISRPRINLYRALHSTHFGPGRKLVEVIIRTEDMDKIASDGISAVYSVNKDYKPINFNENEVEAWVKWMQDILEAGEEDAIQKIWGSIKLNLYEEEITTHVKDHASINLPKGSCIVDLAFAINDDLGFHSISAKVNNEIKNLDYILNNNDYIKIISSPNTRPAFEWQNWVITNNAVIKLHNYFKVNNSQNNSIFLQNTFQAKLKLICENRNNALFEIRNIIGIENINRIYLFTTSSFIEAAIQLSLQDKQYYNIIFNKLLSIKGLKSIEKI